MIDKKRFRIVLKSVLFTAAGALLGFLYYKEVGCVTGTCAITSDPLKSALYGAVLGFLVSNIFTIKKQSENLDKKKEV